LADISAVNFAHASGFSRLSVGQFQHPAGFSMRGLDGRACGNALAGLA
jgi:hypothetical protein